VDAIADPIITVLLLIAAIVKVFAKAGGGLLNLKHIE
jgi:hypothetical protein